MWTATNQAILNERGHLVMLKQNGSPLSYAKVLDLWEHSPDFRAFFIDLLRQSPFTAYKWETPPITTQTVKRPFECVMLNSPTLARRPNMNAFADQFASAQQDTILEFQNLSGDATLLTPYPSDSQLDYCHLAAFVKNAPESLQSELWRCVATAVRQHLSTQPLWLSTAGGGVPWLHVRLDTRPKYYGYQPYKYEG